MDQKQYDENFREEINALQERAKAMGVCLFINLSSASSEPFDWPRFAESRRMWITDYIPGDREKFLLKYPAYAAMVVYGCAQDPGEALEGLAEYMRHYQASKAIKP